MKKPLLNYRQGAIIIYGVLTLLAIINLRSVWVDWWDLWQVSQWETVEGTIQQAGKGGIANYTYTVEGQTYRQHRLYFFERLRIGMESSERSALRQAYYGRVGEPITVTYNPKSPDRAIIMANDFSTPYGWICSMHLVALVMFGLFLKHGVAAILRR
ncbi:MAG: DUF3592 domain-containing protein [Chloroflexota bacterium]